MEFLSNYGMFFAKFFTIIVGIIILFVVVGALIAKAKEKSQGKLSVKKINDVYEEYRETLSHSVLNRLELKIAAKEKKKSQKMKEKEKSTVAKKTENTEIKSKFYVINFEGDLRATAVDALREEVTAILSFAKPNDQVLVKISSGGGVVHGYGLAASQLARIKAANLKLIVAIDKVAASGGYLMACVADHIIAAPFAIVGSIGVLAQIPNFHRLLKKNNIDFEQIMAGNYKRTLTFFGENTEKGREKLQQEVDETHVLFKDFIRLNRSQVPIDQVATGEHWYASQALEFKLVDELKTSDDFLLSASKDYDLFEISYKIKRNLGQRLGINADAVLGKFL